MQTLHIDTSKLPEGVSIHDVFETIVLTMTRYIGEFEQPSDDCAGEKAVLASLVDPVCPERHLDQADVEYLTVLGRQHDVEGWSSWGANEESRAKLCALGFAHVGTARPHLPLTCYITGPGRAALRRLGTE